MARSRRSGPPPAKRPDTGPTKAVGLAVNTTQWQGPLPPPAALSGFNDVVDGGAERIFSEWEKETAHRRKYEHRALTAQISERIGSRILAFLFSAIALGTAGYVGMHGHDWLAGVIATTTIVGVVTAFLAHRK